MNQILLPGFDKKEPAAPAPRTVVVEYSSSNSNYAIAQAREQFGQGVAVIAVPRGCGLMPRKRTAKKKGRAV